MVDRSSASRRSAMKSTASRTWNFSSSSARSALTLPNPIARNTASYSPRSPSSERSRPSALPVWTVMPPIPSSQSTSAWAKPSTVLQAAMPYPFSPPALGFASNRSTACPFIARRWAQASPAGPAPTTAMRRPVGSARVKGCAPSAMRISVAKRCSRPISTGLPSAASRMQASSHSCSVGQTRAHMPPRMFCSKIVRAAPRAAPAWISRMNSGMSMAVGQAVTQGASWQK